MINLGTSIMQDFALGGNLVERIDLGVTTIFDPYTTLTGTLPFSFNSRVAGGLKNYRVFGTAAGAGIETINLLDVNAKDTSNGYVSNAYLTYQGAETASDNYDISEYIPILAETDYSIIARLVNSPAVCFYDDSKQFIYGERYLNQRPRIFTTPENAAYLRMTITRLSGNADMLLLGNYSTRPEFEAYGYKIPLVNTSGQNADSYPLFIGNAKLGEEEYADFGEQKVYKRTENLLNDALATNRVPIISGGVEQYAVSVGFSGVFIPVQPSTRYTGWNLSSSTSTNNRYVFFCDANKKIIGHQQYSVISNPKAINTTSDTLYICVPVKNTQLGSSAMVTKGTTEPETFLPFYKPTDPPVPLPAISAYKGENTLSSTESVGEVTVKGRISPVRGYAVTQAAYDQLTLETGKYYAIISTATGEKIWAVKELTQAEYDQLTPVENTLYIIMNNGAVSNVMYVNTAVDALYLGSTKVWSASHMPEWMHSGIEELLESTSFVSDNYVDIAYVFTTPAGNRDQAYFRVCATSDIVTGLYKSANYYSVFQNPYSSSYRGFYTYDFYYNTTTNEWYLASTTSVQDRGKTENANTSYSHKAIIQNTFITFTNETGETNWEDYR